jgi:hypothetical protein
MLAPGPGMLGSDDQDQLVARDGLAREYRIVHNPFYEAQFGGTIAHRGRSLSGVTDAKTNLDPGIGAAE